MDLVSAEATHKAGGPGLPLWLWALIPVAATCTVLLLLWQPWPSLGVLLPAGLAGWWHCTRGNQASAQVPIPTRPPTPWRASSSGASSR